MKTDQSTQQFATGQEAWAYSRFSTRQQAAGDSSRRQSSNAARFAAKHALKLQVLHDAGISGRHGRNATCGQLRAFIDALERGELGKNPVLLIENFDRLSRQQLDEAQALFLQLINQGVRLVTLHNEKVYQKPLALSDALMALVEMDVARQYSDNLSMRAAASWERARSAGTCMHRKSTPGWIRQVKANFELIPDRVALVREIFRRYYDGEGTQEIAVSLNRQRVGTWSHLGQASAGWHATQIKNLLRNRALLGEYQPHRDVDGGKKRVPAGAVRQGYFPPVFFTEEDRKLFFSVQDRLARVPKRGKPIRDHWNLLAGVAVSAVDESAMWGQKFNLSRQSIPKNYLKSRGSVLGFTQPSHFVVYEHVEPRILSLLRGIDAGAFKVPDAATGGGGVASAEAAVACSTKQVAKLRRLILADDDPSPTLVAELKAQEKELSHAKAKLAAEFDRQERGAAGAFRVNELDLNVPSDRAKLAAAIQRNFDSVVFYRDAGGRDFFVAWLDSERSDGFACFVDKSPGPFSFWSPRERRLSAIA